jgi:hypothetical protein
MSMSNATHRALVENAANNGRSYPAKRQRIEDKLQIDVVNYLRLVLDPKRYKVAAVRNEGKRSEREGALAKAMGLTPGMPDLVIIGPLCAAYWIELKSNSGKLSAWQDAMRMWMIGNGVPYAVCRSVDQVHTALVAWNIPTREAANA